MKNAYRKSIAAAIIAVLFLISLGSVLQEGAEAATNEYSFTSCLQEKGQAHVLIMMDESGSIYGSDTTKATDPKNVRIAGSQILMDRIQEVADRFEKPINVQLSGFGDNFVARPTQNWTALEPGSQTNLKSLFEASKVWADRNKTKNWMETDLVSAIAGARDVLASAPAESCKLFVFFKDGNDFHLFRDRKSPSEVKGYDDINDLLKAHKIDKAIAAGVNEICRDGGLADSLRTENNLFSIGVGISSGQRESEGFQKFRAVIEGKPAPGCKGGALPAHGKYVLADDIGNLPAIFADVLDPGSKAPSETGNFYLDLKKALTGIRVLSAGVTSKTFTIVPPKSCSGKAVTFKAADGDHSDLVIGSSVSATAKWMGDDSNLETLSVVLKHTDLNDDSCWVGRWEFKPGDGAISSLYFDADLQAVATFSSKSPYVVPGETQGTEYSIVVNHPSDSSGSSIVTTTLDKDLTLTLNGFVRNADTKVIEDTFQQFNISGDQLGDVRTLVAGTDQPFGKYELVLTLSVKVAGFNYDLMPISTQSTFEVRTAKAPPTISKIVDFGALKGTDRARGTIEITGSAEEDYVIDFSKKPAAIVADSFPEGVSYVFAFQGGEKQTLTIPKGQKVKVDVWIQAQPNAKNGDSEVHAKMPISGKIMIAAAPASDPSAVSTLTSKFKAQQSASSSNFWRLILLLVFLFIALAINFLIIKLFTGQLARTPKSDTLVRFKYADVEFNELGFMNTAAIRNQVANLDSFEMTGPNPDRRSISLGRQTAVVKKNGLSLSHIGHLELPEALGKQGFSSNNPTVAVLPLSLTSSYAFYTDVSSLSAAKNGSTVSGTLIIVRQQSEQKLTGEIFDEFEQQGGALLRDLIEKAPSVSQVLPAIANSWGAVPGIPPVPPQEPPVGGLFARKPKQPPQPPTQSANTNLDQW